MVTWGSQDGAPYVSGVPVGRVDSVYSSLRETTQRAVIEPFVDFSALDVVGVVVPSGTRQRPRRHRGGREPAVNPLLHRCRGRWPRSSPSRWPWCCRSRCSRTWRSQGVVPDLVLLVVVAAALAHGSELGLVLGFAAGLLLDLAPPADHVAGRWALALMVVGYVAGRLAAAGRPRVGRSGCRWPAASAFVGTSVFALTGLLLRDPAVGVGELLRVEVVALAWDVVLALVVVPLVLGLFARVEPDRVLGVTASGGETRSRLRLVVIQALVFSLFATLLVRLYYLQVVSGEEYAAQAASQSVREIVVQPQRGLIVDDMGRPLVANRTSWVVSIDRGTLAKLPDDEQRALLRRVARVTDVAVPRIHRLLTTCGDEKSVVGDCWNGSPFQPVPIAVDVPQPMALRVLEQPEDFPGVTAEQQSLRAYPRPFGINARARARLPQPDHRRRVRPGQGRRRQVGQRRLGGRPGRRREGVRRVAARDARLHLRSRSTRWAG